ncbi:MAG: hypothetical protein H6881_08315 [Rhodobiaceae bacterium]|nr:hypothetical protein [Rhodobiaceae bacterium]MCC0051867.1 hypothetical protein [Rhodobiaceae bacterium]
MAYTFPLAATVFADLLSIAQVRFWLPSRQEVSGLGSGLIIAAELSPPLWMAEVSLAPMEEADAGRVQAIIETLDGAINEFYLYNPRRKYPLDDPDGSTIGASAVKIKANQNGKELQLKSLPAGYTLKAGDFLSWSYNSMTMFHRISEDATADGSGNTGWFEVRPHLIASSAAADTAVSLKKPAMRAIMVPGSFDPGTTRPPVITEGMSFQAIQSFRT